VQRESKDYPHGARAEVISIRAGVRPVNFNVDGEVSRVGSSVDPDRGTTSRFRRFTYIAWMGTDPRPNRVEQGAEPARYEFYLHESVSRPFQSPGPKRGPTTDRRGST
jgi:hypothetical protein